MNRRGNAADSCQPHPFSASSSTAIIGVRLADRHLVHVWERLGVVEENPSDLTVCRRIAGLQGHAGRAGRVHLQVLSVLDVHVHQEVQLLFHVLHLRERYTMEPVDRITGVFIYQSPWPKYDVKKC